MENAPSPSSQNRVRHHREYEDPHYHDEDYEVPSDERQPKSEPAVAARRVLHRPPVRRRYDD